ncbi:MAG: hypothetical protein ACK41Y_16490, partial [Paracoccus hibiscisoli]|uniref:hypothetical protein n=1 Tax=Paracoccus hibiscisoli TaxID=2023261 RepID=UPI00391C79BA
MVRASVVRASPLCLTDRGRPRTDGQRKVHREFGAEWDEREAQALRDVERDIRHLLAFNPPGGRSAAVLLWAQRCGAAVGAAVLLLLLLLLLLRQRALQCCHCRRHLTCLNRPCRCCCL